MFTFYIKTARGAHRGDIVRLPDATEYSIVIRSLDRRRGNAEVKIDGKSIGAFRVENDDQEIVIERPANIDRRLTFYALGSEGASKAGLVSHPRLGQVEVTFTPEVAPSVFYDPRSYGAGPPVEKGLTRGIGGYGSGPTRGIGGNGGTGLGNVSSQMFIRAMPLIPDPSSASTKVIQLMAEDPEAHQMVDIIPLHGNQSISQLQRIINATERRAPPPNARKVSIAHMISPRESSKGTKVYPDDRFKFTFITHPDVKVPRDFNELKYVSTRKRPADDMLKDEHEFMGPILTGERIVAQPCFLTGGPVYNKAVFHPSEGGEVWYTAISMCPCGKKCDGTCNNEFLVHVAEVIHPGVKCDISGLFPIIGERYAHEERNFDICKAEYDKLTEEEKKPFLLLAYPDSQTIR